MVPSGRLRQRRLLTWIGYLSLLALIAAAGLDRWGRFGYAGDDWAQFDRRAVVMDEVVDGDTFVAHLAGAASARITVRLLGVDAPDLLTSHWSTEAQRYLTARLVNREVILRLDGTQTRDPDAHLLALVYVTDGDCLNVDIVRDGQAYADRRVKHAMRSPLEQAERDARAKKRGMWRDLRDEDQPQWRREWLQTLRNKAKDAS
jgi:endonuclease YncB( thermonuclease family)